MGAASLIVLMLAAVFFSAAGILVSKLVLKATKNPAKGQTYECGVVTQGPSWVQFNVGYYLFALIFLIFDVELIFLYPWAVVVKKRVYRRWWRSLFFCSYCLWDFCMRIKKEH